MSDAPTRHTPPPTFVSSKSGDNSGCFLKAALGCFGLAVLCLAAAGAGLWWVWDRTLIPEQEALELAAEILPLDYPGNMEVRGGVRVEDGVFLIASDLDIAAPEDLVFFIILYQGGPDSKEWVREEMRAGVFGERIEGEIEDSGEREFQLLGAPIQARWFRLRGDKLEYDVVFDYDERKIGLFFSGPTDKVTDEVVQSVLDSVEGA